MYEIKMTHELSGLKQFSTCMASTVYKWRQHVQKALQHVKIVAAYVPIEAN